MIIRLERPVFKCQEDEKIFFSRLGEIAAIESVVGDANGLRLTVVEGMHDVATAELQLVCDVWHTKFEVPAG